MKHRVVSRNLGQAGRGWCALVGAPRCGTTSLAHYLSGHPDICFSNPKEPHYFSRRDLRSLAGPELERVVGEQYLDHFFRGREGGALLAEGSVSYLYAPQQVLPVLKIWPDAKFIITVRNPLSMLPSLHQRNLFNGDESEPDFERAWALVEERRLGRHVPRSCIDARLLDYKEIGRLGRHVRRFFDLIGRHRCFVSVFDDLVADPKRQYRRIVDFLGLPADSRSDFPVHRASAGAKIMWLQRFLKRPPKTVFALMANDKDLLREGLTPELTGFGRKVKVIGERILDWNRAEAPPVALDPELRDQIRRWMHDDIGELSGLIERDLSHWLAAEGRPAACPAESGKRQFAGEPQRAAL